MYSQPFSVLITIESLSTCSNIPLCRPWLLLTTMVYSPYALGRKFSIKQNGDQGSQDKKILHFL